MVSIMYNYLGIFNDETIKGFGNLLGDPKKGDFEASAIFQSFPERLNPIYASWSFFSVSCHNIAKGRDGIKNILELTNGDYTSIRRVEAFDDSAKFLGSISINGRFIKVAEDVFTGNVCVAGTYRGPTDLLLTKGYELPLEPEGEFKLAGKFELEIKTESGTTIKTNNEQTYYFNNGVKESLVSHVMDLSYDTDKSFWLEKEKVIKLVGTTILKKRKER